MKCKNCNLNELMSNLERLTGSCKKCIDSYRGPDFEERYKKCKERMASRKKKC